ncbi:hypothetical protein GWI68_09320 [Proteus sp. G2669]|uniref:hypothetical protein n=1 Tax=Proteus TaxID=583 RepID=UPI000D695F28|nr:MULTISPECIES: hypothetical protein [Proteus]NBM54983.1 hypothetical protein [Proteus sp. G2669]
MKKIKILFLISLAFVISTLSSCDNKQADIKKIMHGFKWHQSMDDIKKLDLANLKCTSAPEGWACSSWSSPYGIKDSYYYFFVVLRDKGLASLLILELKNQNNQQTLLNNYNKLNQSLFNIFGPPSYQIDNIPRDNTFFQCLENKECGEIKSQYDTNNVTTILNVIGDNNGGRLSLLMAIDNNDNINYY